MNAYGISCSTGCSCCSNENHLRGPYKTLESAKASKQMFHDIKLLASQYASNGLYGIFELHDIEQLPDGRLILGHTILDGFCEDTGDDMLPGDTWDYNCTYIADGE